MGNLTSKLTETQEQVDKKLLLNRLKDTANKLNRSLKIPVPWVPARNTNVAINNMCAVQHILLLKKLSSGIIRRSANDFLCGKLVLGSNNKVESKFYDGEGRLYPAPICCKECLKIAKRWENK